MRLFVAINLPESERQRLFEATAALRSGRFPFRWVLPESMHLTLRFLGEVGEGDVAALEAALGRVAARNESLALSVGGIGAFPDLRRPRVLWAGVDGGPQLIALQADVERALTPLGYEPERRAWSPHLTLARADRKARPSSFSGLGPVAAAVTYRAEVAVTSVDLMRSHLGRGGARYERMACAALGGAEAYMSNRREAGQ